MTGIESTKAAITGLFDMVSGGIKIAKSFGAIRTEIADLNAAEIVEIIVQVATVEVPAIIEDLKK